MLKKIASRKVKVIFMKILKLFATFLLFSYIGLSASTCTLNPAKALLTDIQRAEIESIISEKINEEAEDTADWIVVDKDIDAASVRRLNNYIDKLPKEISELIEREDLKLYLTGTEEIFDRIAEGDEIVAGYYDLDRNVIYIRKYYEDISTLHEIGHFVNAYTNNSDFTKIAEVEGHRKLLEKIECSEEDIEYLLGNKSEYFASCFQYFFQEPNRMKKYQPKTYEYFSVFS